MPPSLTLSTSILPYIADPTKPPSFVADLTGAQWGRSIRGMGGFWTGELTLPPSRKAFDEWMGYHFEERSGPVTFEGMVYEMELCLDGMVYRRSLDDMFNRTMSWYVPPDHEEAWTVWYDAATSQTQYGRKEAFLRPDTSLSIMAERVAKSYLQEHAWPWPWAVDVAREDRLTVTICGYGFTMDWQINTEVESLLSKAGSLTFKTIIPDGTAELWDDAQDFTLFTGVPGTYAHYSVWAKIGSSDDIAWGYIGELSGAVTKIKVYSDANLVTNAWMNVAVMNPPQPGSYKVWGTVSEWIRDMVTLVGAVGCEYLTPGNIQTNYAIANRDYDNGGNWRTIWDVINEFAPQASPDDTNNTPWVCWVDVGRVVNYQKIDIEPRYYYQNGRWLGSPSGPEVDPWQLRPAVVRDLSWKFAAPRSGYWLADERDFYVEEFEVDAQGQVRPRIANISATETLLTRLSTERRTGMIYGADYGVQRGGHGLTPEQYYARHGFWPWERQGRLDVERWNKLDPTWQLYWSTYSQDPAVGNPHGSYGPGTGQYPWDVGG